MNAEPDDQPVLNEEPDDSGLDARHERMILALLEHPTHDKAAAALGISTVTLWRATKKPEFAEPTARRDATHFLNRWRGCNMHRTLLSARYCEL